MKVIKTGVNKDWWVGKHVTCEGCRAVLELESFDPVKEYRNECGIQIYFTCPDCQKEGRLYFQSAA